MSMDRLYIYGEHKMTLKIGLELILLERPLFFAQLKSTTPAGPLYSIPSMLSPLITIALYGTRYYPIVLKPTLLY